jgi:hypothetical protein
VLLGHPLGDRKPQARSGDRLGVSPSIEALEDPRQVVFIDAASGVNLRWLAVQTASKGAFVDDLSRGGGD